MLAVKKRSLHPSGDCPRATLLFIEPIERDSQPDGLLLLPGKCLLGSSDDCTLTLPTNQVRPRHCLIVTDNSRSLIRAIGADTWLNEARVREAVLNPGDRLTVGPVHFRVREATMSERLESLPAPPQADPTGIQRVPSNAFASEVTANPVVEGIRDEIERQLSRLKDEVGSQQQKFTDALERQNVAVQLVVEQQREANESDERIETARRKESLIHDLLLSLQIRSEELIAEERELSQVHSRHKDELSRRANDMEIEAAVVRSRQRRLDLQKRELEGRVAWFEEQSQDWEESKRRTEQVLAQREREVSELQTDLNRRQIVLDRDDEKLRQRQAESQLKSADLEQLAASLQAEQQSHHEEHAARKQALSARLTGMAHWDAANAQRQGELEALTETLHAREEQIRHRVADLQRRQDSVAVTAEDQVHLQVELAAQKQERQRQEQQLQKQADELEQLTAQLEERRQQLNEKSAQQSATTQDHQTNLTQINARAGEVAKQEESLAARQAEIADWERRLQAQQKKLDEHGLHLTKQEQDEQHRLQQEQIRIDVSRTELTELTKARHEELQIREIALDRRENELSELTRLREADRIALDSKSEELASQKTLLAEESQLLEQSRQSVTDAEHELEREMAVIRDEQQQLANSQNECAQKRQELEQENRQLEAALQDFESSRNELVDERNSLDEQRRTLDELKASLESERQQLNQLRGEIGDNQDEIDRAELQAEQTDCQREQEALTAAQAELQTDRDSLDVMRAGLDEKRAAIDEEAAKLDIQQQQLALDIAGLAAREDDWELRQQEFKVEQSDFAEQCGTLETDRENLDADREELQHDQNQLEETRSQLEARRDDLREQQEELSREREQFNGRQTDLAYRELELDGVRRQSESESEQLAALKEADDGKRNEILAEREQLRIERQLLQDAQDNWNRTCQSTATEESDQELQLEDERDRLQSERAVLNAELEELAAQKRKGAGEAQQLAQERVAVENEQARLEAERAEFEAERRKIQDEWSDLQAESDPHDSGLPKQIPAQSHHASHSVLTDDFSSPDQLDAGPEPNQPDWSIDEYLQADEQHSGSEIDPPVDDAPEEGDDLLSLFEKSADELAAETTSQPLEGDDVTDNIESVAINAEDSTIGNSKQQETPGDLHSTLAEMFDILPNEIGPGTDAVDVDAHRDSAVVAGDTFDDDVPDESDLTSLLETFDQDESLTDVTPINETSSADCTDTEPASDSQLADADDPDSIASYMEQLLARSRKHVDSSTVQQAPAKAPATTTRKPTAANEPAPAADVSAIPATDATSLAPSSHSLEISAAPAHEQDKVAVRADLNSLRQLANLSARTEIATHASKELHGKILVKSLLTVTSFTIAGVLLTSESWGTLSYDVTGWAAALVGLIVAAELARTTLLVHSVDSNGDSNYLSDDRKDPMLPHAATAIVPSDEDVEPIEIDAYVIDDEQVMPPTDKGG